MEGSKFQFNGHTEGFFIGQFVFDPNNNLSNIRVRYHNFITAIFVRIFGSGIIDIKTEQGNTIHLNKGSVQKLVADFSKFDRLEVPDYLENLKKLLAPSPEEGSCSLKNDPPEKMSTDANELHQKDQSYSNNQNTEKTDVKVQTKKTKKEFEESGVPAKKSVNVLKPVIKENSTREIRDLQRVDVKQVEEYKEKITTFLKKEQEKLKKIEEDFLKLDFNKENAVAQITLLINNLPKLEDFPELDENWKNTDARNELDLFLKEQENALTSIKTSMMYTRLKLNTFLYAANLLTIGSKNFISESKELAKEQAKKYPNDPMFKKLFKLFDITL